MRIIAGKFRGRKLEAPEGEAVRPTSDRAREALFNVLTHGRYRDGGGSAVEGAVVLDAFCGTGALGLEALSRGAARITLLDSDAKALDGRTEQRARRSASRARCRMRWPTRPSRPRRDWRTIWPSSTRLMTAISPGPALKALAAGGLDRRRARSSSSSGRPRRPDFDAPTRFAERERRKYGAATLDLPQLRRRVLSGA